MYLLSLDSESAAATVHSYLVLLVSSLIFKDALLKLLRHLPILISLLLISSVVLNVLGVGVVMWFDVGLNSLQAWRGFWFMCYVQPDP